MPSKITVGLNKKIGQRDYGSLAANCSVEFELGSALPQQDAEAFHRQVRSAYAACAQAVNEELARQQGQASRANGARSPSGTPAGQASASSNGNGRSSGNGGGKGSYQASEKQLEYIRRLASQIKGLGVRRLEALAQRMFSKPVAALSSLDASSLIDTMKGIKAGEIDLDTVLGGTAP